MATKTVGAAKRRNVGQSKRRSAEDLKDGVKVSAVVCQEAHQRLVIHALMAGKSSTQFLEELLLNLKDWKLAPNGPRGVRTPDASDDRPDLAAEVIESGELMAA